tara:strand:+ start:94 stop:795 length:702 start_codon:yes stop_codon:yes gene_type:complete
MSEKKTYKDQDLLIKNNFPYKKSNINLWSNRLIKNLKQIETDYVIPILDDFFIELTVNQKKIEEFISILDKYTNSAVIYFSEHSGGGKPTNIHNDLLIRPKKIPYKVSAQIGIWRVLDLLYFIKPFENPWQFEIHGSKRAWYSDKNFFVIKSNDISPIRYTFTGVLKRGKWIEKVINNLIFKYELKIILNKRGIDNNIKKNYFERILDFFKRNSYFFINRFKYYLWVLKIIKL